MRKLLIGLLAAVFISIPFWASSCQNHYEHSNKDTIILKGGK